MTIETGRVAAALRAQAAALVALADAIDQPAADSPAPSATAAAPKRGRGRPVAGETGAPAPSAAPATAPAATEADPFAEAAAAPAQPTATLEEVRAALTALSKVTSQARALEVLKAAGGVSNLTDLQKTPEKYGAVVLAAQAAIPQAEQPEADPFDTAVPVAPEKPAPTIEEVKAACVAGAKKTSQDTVLKVIFAHGGRAPKPDGSGEGPSLGALPKEKYQAVIDAINALPKTK